MPKNLIKVPEREKKRVACVKIGDTFLVVCYQRTPFDCYRWPGLINVWLFFDPPDEMAHYALNLTRSDLNGTAMSRSQWTHISCDIMTMSPCSSRDSSFQSAAAFDRINLCAYHLIFLFFLFCRADLVLYWYGQFSFETIRFRLMLGGRQFNGNDWRVRKDSHFKQQKKEEEQEQEMIWWWKTTSNLESSKPPLINNKNPFKFNNYCRITTVQWMLIWPK